MPLVQKTLNMGAGAGYVVDLPAPGCGRLDVLAKARIVATLDEALDGLTHLCATAMTPRDFGPPTWTPREHFASLAGTGHVVGLAAETFNGSKDDDGCPDEPADADGDAALARAIDFAAALSSAIGRSHLA